MACTSQMDAVAISSNLNVIRLSVFLSFCWKMCGIWKRSFNQVNQIKTNSLKKKELSKTDIPAAVTADTEYQESNSGSYSTTTTLSINKNELIGGKMLSLPPPIRWVNFALYAE